VVQQWICRFAYSFDFGFLVFLLLLHVPRCLLFLGSLLQLQLFVLLFLFLFWCTEQNPR